MWAWFFCFCFGLEHAAKLVEPYKEIYPSESQSPSIIGHSSLQSKFAKKLHTHTQNKSGYLASKNASL
jgi:hypothetical protein